MKQFLLILIGVLSLASCQNTQQAHFQYEISPVYKDSTAQLKVVLQFTPEADGTTTLLFQDKAWGQDSLHGIVADIQVLDVTGEVTPQPEEDKFELSHPENLESIRVSYLLKQDFDGDLTTRNDFRPVISEDYFHVFSHMMFMLPQHIIEEQQDDFSVQLDWINFPESFQLVNSFGRQQTQQFIPTISESEFHSAIWTGGDFRVYPIDIEGNEVIFSIRGDWEKVEDQVMVDLLTNTVTAQRDFWQDHSQPYFLVSMIPTVQDRGYSFHGTGLTHSFAVAASNNEYLEVEGLAYLFNHELMHNWTGKLIENDNEEEQYWFSEGFTEYYTFKNVARNNIYNLGKEFLVEKMNESIFALYTSPVLAAPNSEMNYENFWSNPDYGKLAYYRGALFAMYLDHRIQRQTDGHQSLDDVMLAIKDAALTDGQKLTHDFFIATVNSFLKEDITPFFQRHIVEGVPMDVAQIYTEFGFEFAPESQVFDLGFQVSENKKIQNLDLTSNAYQAGLREGDKISKASYQYEPDVQAEFSVLRDGKEQSVVFYPAKLAPIPELLKLQG